MHKVQQTPDYFCKYFTARHNFVLNLGFTSTRKKKKESKIIGNIYICWQTSIKRDCMTVLVMNSKMSPVRCSLRKRFIASLRNSHKPTFLFPLKFFCPVSTGHKALFKLNILEVIEQEKSFKFLLSSIKRVNYKIHKAEPKQKLIPLELATFKIILVFTKLFNAKEKQETQSNINL